MNHDSLDDFVGKVFGFVFVWGGVQYFNPELPNGYTFFIAVSIYMLIIYYCSEK